MINFEFCFPAKFVLGRGAEAKTGGWAKTFGYALGTFRSLPEADVCENRKLGMR